MKETLKNIAPIFKDMDKQIHSFKRETYADVFSSFMEANRDFFRELNASLAAEEEKGFMEEFADTVCSYVREMKENAGSKIKKENMQMNLNMFMAIYFMPAILEGKQARAKELTDIICEKWSSVFKGNNIKGADYATISSGFKSKLCYVTTAVCKSLDKPEDCYELNLLKSYRDNYLLRTEEGEELVRKYYDIAPTIVKRIDKSENPEEKYWHIWENYLKPCIELIESGQSEECGRTYISMVEELQEQYAITAKRSKKQQEDMQ